MDEPFYAEGLRFSCQRCSSCCRGGPGYVFLAKDDLRRLLARFGLDLAAFIEKYCVLVDTGLGFAISLAEKPNFDCVLLGGNGACEAYEARPVQCSTFPFWASLLDSEEDWEAEGKDCPGIGKGELRSKEHIEECLWRRRAAGTILLSRAEAAHPEKLDADTLLGR